MTDPMRSIRQLVWLYFWLLLTEGALRKWIVPGLSSALLIVRDPVVIAIYAAALARGLFPRTALVGATVALALCCAAASLAGIGTPAVTAYGLRANFLHLPLIVLLPRIFRPEDVRRMGHALLLTLPVMVVLAVLQFKGGPDSRWNVGAGGQIGGQLYASEGKVRVSGTFSFVTGIASYLALCSAFLLSDLLARRAYPRWLVFAGGLSLMLTLAISGSRTAVVTVAVVCSMVLYIAWRNPSQFGSVLKPILFLAAILGVLMATTSIFSEGVLLHQNRFASAGGVKEGIIERYFENIHVGWGALFYTPVLGHGIGVGTNAGASLMQGERFSLGESEWQRVVLELGWILGPAYLALRCAYLIEVLRGALRGYAHERILPMLLLGAGGVDLVTGQFGQPTTLGFAVFVAGLALAAAGEDTEPVPSQVAAAPQPAAQMQRGRSVYAERLHSGNDEDAGR